MPYSEMVAAQTQAEVARQRWASPAANGAAAAPAMGWIGRAREKAQTEKEKGEFIPGDLFIEGQPPTTLLYNMLAMIDAPDPRIKLEKVKQGSRTEKYLDFLDYIQKVHALFKKHVRGRHPATDDVIHRVAFAFTIGLSQTNDYTLDLLFFEAVQQKMGNDKVQVWTPILRILREMYCKAGFGWRWAILDNGVTWRAELALAKSYDFSPRPLLFPSYVSELEKYKADQKTKSEKAAKAAESKMESDAKAERDEQVKRGTYTVTYSMQRQAEASNSLSSFAFGLFARLGSLAGGTIPGKQFIECFLQSGRAIPAEFFEALKSVMVETDDEKQALEELLQYMKDNGINEENRTLRKAS